MFLTDSFSLPLSLFFILRVKRGEKREDKRIFTKNFRFDHVDLIGAKIEATDEERKKKSKVHISLN